MIILRTNYQSFTLHIVGYEFPNATCLHDKQWLNVRIKVSDPNYHWQAIDPCIMTSELTHLKEWFYGLHKSKGSTSIHFMEPEIALQYDSITNNLFILLNYGFHPQYNDNHSRSSREPYKLSFPVYQKMLNHIQEQISKYIENYP